MRKEDLVYIREKSLALKVEKALKSMSQDFPNEDDEECEDSELAQVMKKFWKKSQPGRSSAPPIPVEIRCYNCQEMGHFASSCTKSKMDQGSHKDQRKQEALVSTAWGKSESDEEDDDKRGSALVTSLDTQICLSLKNSV